MPSLDLINRQRIRLRHNGATTSMRPLIGVGPRGPEGPAGPGGGGGGSANPMFTDMVYDGEDLTSWEEDGVLHTAAYEDGPNGERRIDTLTVDGVTRTFTYDTEGRMTGAT